MAGVSTYQEHTLLPQPQLQCAGTTTGSLLISLVTIAIDLQNTVLYILYTKRVL